MAAADGSPKGVIAGIPTVEINVPLLDEGISVWRPTQAESLGDGLFRLLPLPDGKDLGEKWEFPPGSIVAAEIHMLYQAMNLAPVLVAINPELH